MDTKTKNTCQTNAKAPYQPPQLKVWGTVAELTRLGHTSGSGDVLPSGASNDDGSVTWAQGSGKGGHGHGHGKNR
ncbi:lasso RiPP family leader peptide-containing protein [Halomonas sp.]|uniref:Lasso RiPP family leader peptide-containing protein n=1 Tax=Halomonas ventosae TaxID=229007 RepID=A0A4R6I696_9GAMM|nr:hypothetical protein DFO68_101187 [Halomonas ventosae]